MQKNFQLVARGEGPYRERYRPQNLNELVPTTSIARLRQIIKRPTSQVYLLSGPTGTGKTTTARILAKALTCQGVDKPCLNCWVCEQFSSSLDVTEINAANFNKVDDVRNLVASLQTLPAFFPKTIFILDEVQRYTRDAQQILLAELENPPPHLLFFLCTTDPSELLSTLRGRTTEIPFAALNATTAKEIIHQLLGDLPASTGDALYAHSQGSIRALLNAIQSYAEKGVLPEDLEQLQIADAKLLFQALIKKDWKKAARILQQPEVRSQAEELRRATLNYARGAALQQNQQEALASLPILSSFNGYLIIGDQYNDLVTRCLRIIQ